MEGDGDILDAFDDAGVGVVVVTYDAPELQAAFLEASGITYPLISDIETTTMRALGILNEDYSPGDPAFGIPHPGVFVVDRSGTIAGKIFIDSYQERVDGENTLRYAIDVLDAGG